MSFDCAVCDQEGEVEVFHSFPMHSKCAPKYWVADHRGRDSFMAQVRMLAPSREARWNRWK